MRKPPSNRSFAHRSGGLMMVVPCRPVLPGTLGHKCRVQKASRRRRHWEKGRASRDIRCSAGGLAAEKSSRAGARRLEAADRIHSLPR